jgi:hypothetical protein
MPKNVLLVIICILLSFVSIALADIITGPFYTQSKANCVSLQRTTRVLPPVVTFNPGADLPGTIQTEQQTISNWGDDYCNDCACDSAEDCSDLCVRKIEDVDAAYTEKTTITCWYDGNGGIGPAVPGSPVAVRNVTKNSRYTCM